jgi:hypothetical protein
MQDEQDHSEKSTYGSDHPENDEKTAQGLRIPEEETPGTKVIPGERKPSAAARRE